jgi:hypothetical protein
MAARWIDHILGPDTTANRPAPASTPVGALYSNTTTGNLEINSGSAWSTYRSSAAGSGLTDSDIAAVAPNDQTASYTAVLADKHRLVRISNASANTFTIPPNSSVAFDLGTTLQLAQQGAGQCTVTAGAGVTIRTPHGAKTAVQYSMVQAIKVAADEWYVAGDTTT